MGRELSAVAFPASGTLPAYFGTIPNQFQIEKNKYKNIIKYFISHFSETSSQMTSKHTYILPLL